MATHDYVIDNSTGANVRADINSVLQAILTNNSSSSAPSTTAAYMFWADTTTGTLKIRNSSDNAWVELLQLDGTLTMEDGSASTPGLAFRDDLNTGIFSSAADTFNVATAGVERMELGATTIFNESGADVDFRIEGDTEQNLFYVDAGNNHIGINDSTPSVTLDITGEGGGNGEVHVKRTSGASCFIQAQSATAVFGSNSNHAVTFKSNSTTAATIDTSQRFLIGTSSTDNYDGFNSSLQVTGTTGDASSITISRFSNNNSGANLILAKSRTGTVGNNAVLQAGDQIANIQFHGNDGSGFHDAATIQALVASGVGNDDMPADLAFLTNGGTTGVTEQMRLTSGGILLVGKASTSQTHPLQVQCDSQAQAIAIYGRSGDDIGEIAYWENDGTTKLGELQYRQDHVAFRHRVGHIEFATTFSGNSMSERMRLFEDKLLIGTTGTSGIGASRRLQVRGTTHSNNGINILATHNDDNPAVIDIGKSRSSGNAILGNNDDVGQINFYGNDGSGFHSMARILCRCQGHDTSNDDLPAALAFSTLTENTTSLKERLIIDDEGIHSIGSQNHALSVSTTASSGTNKYNFRGHHSGTNGQPGSGTLSFTVWSNGNVENLNNSYGSTSDIKLKENIVDANSQWNDIKAIKIRNYNFKEETGQSTKTQIGLVAQELETVCPKLIYETPDFDDKGEDLGTTTKCISYSVLYIKAIKALQESMAKIEVLETKVAALEAG